jgi:transposase
MYFTAKSYYRQILIWLVWAIVCAVSAYPLDPVVRDGNPLADPQAVAGVIVWDEQSDPLFSRRPGRRLRKWAWQRYCTWLRAHRRALWTARLIQPVLAGVRTMAQIVDLLTRSQRRHHLGALPVLYGLLEVLHVREIVNRHCPTRSKVDHGAVAVVLILNRLVAPRPLYQVADWLGRTMLVHALGISADKFNDDRLGRTLDALSQHSREIWQDIVHRALVQADIDLSVIFYDLTAFITHGEYPNSQLVDFGFAHNTPMGKRKFKTSLNVAADGNIPVEYGSWSGRTADMATVQENMERMSRFFRRRGWSVNKTVIIGDRANLNDELALAYDDHSLRYLAGLQPLKKAHRQLLTTYSDADFYEHPLNQKRGKDGYWGIPCQISFEHKGRRVVHRGLVVLSGPMRHALRQTRADQLETLRQGLAALQAKIGQPHYRTAEVIQKRANTVLKQSPVGKFVRVEVYTDESDVIRLRRRLNRDALLQVMQKDGRYLLATNDWSLSSQQMLDLYRQKDGVEKCFKVSKSNLVVSPIYLHKDGRIEGMLLVNMLALLTYNLLERQARQNGLQMTTRRIIEKLESLDIVETLCWDDSLLYRIVPMDEEQAALLEILARVLADLRRPRWPHPVLPSGNVLPLALPPPNSWLDRAAADIAA